MIDRFLPKKPQENLLKEAVDLRYQEGDTKEILYKADRFYLDANFNNEFKLGLLCEALNRSPMLQFTVL